MLTWGKRIFQTLSGMSFLLFLFWSFTPLKSADAFTCCNYFISDSTNKLRMQIKGLKNDVSFVVNRKRRLHTTEAAIIRSAVTVRDHLFSRSISWVRLFTHVFTRHRTLLVRVWCHALKIAAWKEFQNICWSYATDSFILIASTRTVCEYLVIVRKWLMVHDKYAEDLQD